MTLPAPIVTGEGGAIRLQFYRGLPDALDLVISTSTGRDLAVRSRRTGAEYANYGAMAFQVSARDRVGRRFTIVARPRDLLSLSADLNFVLGKGPV
ncbi:hypothetical protein [Pacificispira sp.]|uniref:hypothetical protein n=1 Tax=Pacificispira sp. TaxID=2888761 RepID=UPI003BAAB769